MDVPVKSVLRCVTAWLCVGIIAFAATSVIAADWAVV
jgi:hypothetical protein